MSALRSIIASMPVIGILDTAMDGLYYSAKLRENHIEELCYHRDVCVMDPKKLENMQYKAIKQSFIHHYNKSNFYHGVCKKSGVTADDIHCMEDIIRKVPQIPAEAFKQGGILSVPKRKIKSVVTTSGTRSNTPSYLLRDGKSMIRFVGVVIRALINPWRLEAMNMTDRSNREIIKYVFTNISLEIFTPSSKESSTWMAQSLGMGDPLFSIFKIPCTYHLENFEFDEKKTMDTLIKHSKENKMAVFWSFHYILNRLMDYMDENGIEPLNLDPTGKNICLCLIGGGWKKLSGESIDRKEFEHKLKEHFGFNDNFIVDFYGLGEADVAAFDFCKLKKHHFLPHAKYVVRDPETLEPVADGEKGLLSVYDPSMNCYPAFVITDDVMRITNDLQKCECGMTAQNLIKFEGRAPGADLRSCGLKTQQIMNDETRELLEKFKAKSALKAGVGVQ